MNTPLIVDSHCHLDRLDLNPFAGKLSEALKAAQLNGVTHILCVSVELSDLPRLIEIAETYPGITLSVGLHPTEAACNEPTTAEIIQLASHPSVVAIGETGLDYYRNEGDLSWQQQRFKNHISAARELGKPLIVHTRQAREDTIKILKSEKAAEVGGVLHCFTEDLTMARQAIELNFYISFSGIVTFNNAKELKEIARQIPLEKILIETDAPYLAPMPHRGKSNQPAYVRYVAEYIAELRGIPYTIVAQQTTDNFFNLFKKARHKPPLAIAT